MTTLTAEVERSRTVDLEHLDGFRFRAHFGDDMPDVVLDENPPLGAGSGPDAARLLGAAIGDCLGASLLLCLQKSRVKVDGLRTHVTLGMARNEQGRLRVANGKVRIDLRTEAEPEKIERCKRVFEDYCIVTATVRRAFPIDVELAVAHPAGEVRR